MRGSTMIKIRENPVVVEFDVSGTLTREDYDWP